MLCLLSTAAAQSQSGTSAGFTANVGQWPAEVRYCVRTGGMNAWITEDGIVYDFYRIKRQGATTTDIESASSSTFDDEETKAAVIEGHVLEMHLPQSAAETEGVGKRSEYQNFFYGDDPAGHFSGVPVYDRVVQRGAAPGIDLHYMLREGRVRYDVHAQPFADVRGLRFRLVGAQDYQLDEDGNLLLHTSLGQIAHTNLYAFQQIGGVQHEVECRFVLQPGGILGFEVGAYNPAHELVIDPIVYSTIVGGSATDDPNDIFVDDDGAAYVTGATASSDFPVTAGAYQTGLIGTEQDVFVFKLDPTGTSRVWATFIGHEFEESGLGVAVDPDDNIIVAGWTQSDRFPTTTGAYDRTQNGARDAFVVKLNSSSTVLLAGTVIGSAAAEECRALDVDRLGNIYITGFTDSRFFPSSGDFRGLRDVFVSKFTPDLANLTWSTFLGGSNVDIGLAIQADADQSVFVGGRTESNDFVMVNAWDNSHNGGQDAFLARVAPDGQSQIFATYIGGTREESLGGIALDDIGDVYIAGRTTSLDFPVTTGTFDENYKGAGDGYYVKMLRDGSDVVYVSYLGAEGAEEVHDVAVTANREPVIYGITRSLAFPVTDRACAVERAGDSDLFISMMNRDGNRILCSSYLGGEGQNEFSRALTIGPDGDFFLTGRTVDDKFPVTDLSEGQGGADVFVTKFNCNQTSLDVDAGPDITICFDQPERIGNPAVGGTGPYKYSWEPEEGLSDPDIAQPQANPTEDTEYTLIVTDATGCRVQDRVIVRVRERLFADAGEDIEVCFGENVQLGGVPTGRGGVGRLTYVWTPTIGLDDPTIANPMVTKSTISPVTYKVTITDAQGCTATDEMTLTAHPFPLVDAGQDRLLCAGAISRLGGAPTAQGPNGDFTYEWKPALGLDDSTAPNPFLELVTNSNIEIEYLLTVSDQKGCTTTDRVKVQFNAMRLAEMPDIIVCPDEEAVLGVDILGFDGDESRLQFNWSGPTGLTGRDTRNPTFKQTLPGSYTYNVIVSDPVVGCQVRGRVEVRILSKPRTETLPLIVNFPTLGGCDNSATQKVTIRNTDTRQFDIVGIEFLGPFSLAQPFSRTTLTANQLVEYSIVYNPPGQGDHNGAVRFILTDCEYVEEIPLHGRKTQADVAISSSVIDLGEFVLCRDPAGIESIKIYNLGEDEVRLEEGAATNPFDIVTSLPRRLPAGDSIEVFVRFTPGPSGSGEFEDEILIPYVSEACSDTLRLRVFGKVLVAEVTASLADVDFPALTGCEQQRDTTIVLRNESDIDVEVRRVDSENQLIADPALPLVIPAGEEREVRIRFRPGGEGDFSGEMQLEYGDCDSTINIPATGAKRGVTFLADAEVDLGAVVDCADDEPEALFNLRYTGDANLDGEVVAVRVDGPFAHDLATGSTLPRDGSPISGRVRLDRTALGNAQGTVRGTIFVQVAPCDIELEIEVRVEVLNAELTLTAASVVDQAQALNGGDLRTIEFVNSGSADLVLGASELDLPGLFSILQSNPPAGSILAPGDTARVLIRFEGDTSDRLTTLQLTSDEPCGGVTATATIRGIGEDVIDPRTGRVTIKVERTRRAVGEEFELLITLEDDTDLAASGATSYEFDLYYHASMMLPLAADQQGTVVNDERVIRFSGPRPDAPGVLHRVPFRSLWGFDSCAVVDIDTVVWSGGDVVTTIENGEICLTDLCEAGGHTRLFRRGAPTAITVRSALPLRTSQLEFAVESLETGHHNIYLMDLTGRRVASILDQYLESESVELQTPLDGMPNGVYMLVVETPRFRLVKMVSLLR